MSAAPTAPPATSVVAGGDGVDGVDTLPAETVAELRLVAPWVDGAAVPVRHTCDGADVSPPLSWSDVPSGAVELALTVTDVDRDDRAHWIVIGIAPDRTGMVEGELPDGAFEWQHSFDGRAWMGPCPPAGEQHRYQFTLHALNQQLEVADDASAAEVIATLAVTALAQSTVTGTYARPG